MKQYKPGSGTAPDTTGSRQFFHYGPPAGTFFKPATGPVIQKEDAAKAPAAPTKTETTEKKDGAKDEKKEEAKIAFGSWSVFEKIWNDIFPKLPNRWKQAGERAKKEGFDRALDPAFGKELISKEIMSLWNLVYAAYYSSTSPYGKAVDFFKGVEMAEQLSGVTGTYLNLVSLGLQMDMEKYLSEKLPDYVKQNLGIFLISGAAAQAGWAGVMALWGKDVDFFSLVGPATASFTEAPIGLKRPFLLNNLPDERWQYPFWKTPEKLALNYTGLNSEAKANTWDLTLGLNFAAIMDRYPKDEKEKKRYSGMELYPYLSYTNNQPVEGKPAPDEQQKFLAGIFGGNDHLYGLLEWGASLNDNDIKEAYGRGGLVAKNFGPLSFSQLTGELNNRPGNIADWRGRINAAAAFELLDNDKWKLQLGGALGGLLPSGKEPGAVDFSTNLLLNYKHRGLTTGLDTTFSMGRQDPFDARSPMKYGVLAKLLFFDTLYVSMEYFKINEQRDALPDRDMRFFVGLNLLAPPFMEGKKK